MSLPPSVDGTMIAFITKNPGGNARSTITQLYREGDLTTIQQLVNDPTHVKIELYKITAMTLIGKHEATVVTEGALVAGVKIK